MNKLILLMLIFCAEASADATWSWDVEPPGKPKQSPAFEHSHTKSEWVLLIRTERYLVYSNPGSIEKSKSGHIVRMHFALELQSVEQVSGVAFKAVSAEAEYDCSKGLYRIMMANAYADSVISPARRNQAQRGRVVNRIAEPGNWLIVSAGSKDEKLLEAACAK